MLTRYPVPGTTKRRLGDALGPGGAAMLHRDLAAHCFSRIAPLAATREAVVEVRYDGGTEKAVRSWLHGPAVFHQQGPGHLGDRLRGAAEYAFETGAERVVLLGSDCPDAGASIVRRAFSLLDEHHMVLGPADDGGYYLAGLRNGLDPGALASVFGDTIPWGGVDVLRATLAAATRHGLDVGTLPTLRDIDRPEDLVLWQGVRARARRVREDARISVVIPAWNEAEHIGAAVRSAIAGGACEVIVADAASDDGTAEAAEQAGAVLVGLDDRSRARQMNAGAKAASGDVVLFLHADCVLPPRFAELVRDALQDPEVVAGAFGFGVADQAIGTSAKTLIRAAGSVRARFGLPYGDQALFLPAMLFADLGGFPDQQTMEDYELALRLRRLGRIARLDAKVLSSARLWSEHGLVRPTATYLAVITGYRLGVPAEKLAPWCSPISDRSTQIAASREQ
jgi:rSAM/selenodomain-associated transferase 2/rSAM/selenodomain-associated transferase 1